MSTSTNAIKKVIELPSNGQTPNLGVTGSSMSCGNGQLYLFGGKLPRVLSSNEYIQDLWEYNLANMQWNIVGNISKERLGRSMHTMLYCNDCFYIVGGENKEYPDGIEGIEVIDAKTFNIKHISLPNVLPRYGHSTVIKNMKLYIIGGYVNKHKIRPYPSDDFIIYDLKTQNLTISKLKFGEIAFHSTFIDEDGKIYVIGGKKENGHSDKIHVYDVYTNIWTTLPITVPNKLNQMSCNYVESKHTAVLIGGLSGNVKTNDITLLFDTKTQTLTENIPQLKLKICSHTSAARNDIIFFFGGDNAKHLRAASFDENFNLLSFEEDVQVRVDVRGKRVIAVEVHEKPELDERVKQVLEECNGCDVAKYESILLEHGYNTDVMFNSLSTDYANEIGFEFTIIPNLFRKRAEVYKEEEKYSHDTLATFTYLTDCETGDCIGKGNFGQVFKGMWLGTTPVAMKEINGALEDPEKLTEIIKEAYVTQLMKHPNLITMYGLYKTDDQLFMVVDLADGSLNTFFEKKQYRDIPMKITMKKLVMMALDCASGMAYLESKKIVHRDLALRNLLYVRSVDGIKVKVADLGLSRKTDTGEYIATHTSFPVRWTAPEAATRKIFNSKSDVWSFGVAFWEILTEGRYPYSKYTTNQDVIDAISKGVRLDKPDILKLPFNSNNVVNDDNDDYQDDYQDGSEEKEVAGGNEVGDEIWSLISKCWEVETAKRPTFKELFKGLSLLLKRIPEEENKEIEIEPEEEDMY
ncbi:Tyrosine protein kinase [Entamoeba marina]